jgi:glucose/arabinose dehydrogenase/cytochrome c5
MKTASSFLLWSFLVLSVAAAQNASFHNAPASAKASTNPFSGKQDAIAAGQAVYQRSCAVCHGASGEGVGEMPSLARGAAQKASDGEVFWFVTRGNVANGMPSWSGLPEKTRWQIVSFIKSLGTAKAPAAKIEATSIPAPSTSAAAPPEPPFTDYRFEKPGTVRRITVRDLPAPYATDSATAPPKVVPRPENAIPIAPPGFKVEMFASGFRNPRLMRRAPDGDIFLAETSPGNIKILRGITKNDPGQPELISVFATGLNIPFGMAFYPPGDDPQYLYVANMDSVVRFPYHNGDLHATGPPQHLLDLPSGGHHRSRDIQFSPDGKKMYVSVGSDQNVDDGANETNRADILELNPDGSGLRVYASGIRNAVGIAFHPLTGELWCSTNERDGLGNDLVPDYITHVQEGGFYGWPWFYVGGHPDPRMEGKHPELKDKVITPDVILQPHNASLQLMFYDGKQFPAEYQGDIFAAEHGSWNRSPRTGYEVIRVPLHQTGHATGEYEDFLTGFVVDDNTVWGRPVGVVTAPDGSLLVSDDGSGSIWRVTYKGQSTVSP